MDTAVDDAVRREIGYLRDLGDESLAEVRSCVRRPLCLREESINGELLGMCTR